MVHSLTLVGTERDQPHTLTKCPWSASRPWTDDLDTNFAVVSKYFHLAAIVLCQNEIMINIIKTKIKNKFIDMKFLVFITRVD